MNKTILNIVWRKAQKGYLYFMKWVLEPKNQNNENNPVIFSAYCM